MKTSQLSASMALILAAGIAQAQSDIVVTKSAIATAGGPYIGAMIGNATYDEAGGDDLSLSILGGYALNDILSVELAWQDYGSSEVKNSNDEVSADAILVSLVGNMPLGNDVAVFGQLGIGSWNYSWGNVDESDTDVFLGVGIEYWVSGSASLRFAYNRLAPNSESGSGDIDETLQTYQAGVVFRL